MTTWLCPQCDARLDKATNFPPKCPQCSKKMGFMATVARAGSFQSQTAASVDRRREARERKAEADRTRAARSKACPRRVAAVRLKDGRVFELREATTLKSGDRFEASLAPRNGAPWLKFVFNPDIHEVFT